MPNKSDIRALLSIYTKGLLIGVANVIPGVSGGTLAITLGIYYRIIYSCSALMRTKGWKNATFLMVLSLGMLTSIVVFSKLIKIYLLDGETREAFLTVFFIGLIAGSIFSIRKEIRVKESNNQGNAIKYCLFSLGFFSVLSLLIMANYNLSFDTSKYQDKKSIEYCLLIASSGVISGSAVILPGISGSLLLLNLGFYKEIVNIVSDLNITLCTIFGVFAATGAGITTLLVKKAIDKHLTKFLYLSIGLISGSILQMSLIITKLNLNPSPSLFIVSAILLITGLYINKMLENTKSERTLPKVLYTEDRT
ncbi:DUF368 domain-containing protein [Borrelia sp. RT1S]|uniref:DUF368 domain-containing protein n=1 Tax=Borrelia sp. RT1S TaxID=2898580 RepID=UPI001E460AC7|nr:DUF368 domain-containing protein [Borrelia sp. RT1S]UGQ17535.1 DUF368 domain-containing protein [Borrelia sp. RT1S]